MPFNSNGKLQLFNSAATQKRQELENVSSKMANASVPLYPTGTVRSERQRDAATKFCSQCQNRARVEVYGGWWFFVDWLGDGGGDAETGGWEVAVC